MKNNLKILSSQFFSNTFIWGWSFSLLLGISSCEEKPTSKNTGETNTTEIKQKRKAPDFIGDSAYSYVAKQVSFGYRVPNTVGHVRCGDYLVASLKKFGCEVIEQEFQAKAFDGTMLKSRNIIGSINPAATKRIILSAHWDTRPFAEKDSLKKDTPIDGANDGGSGVGVILEIMRAINTATAKPTVGIDVIFFDSEDYGHSEGMPGNGSADTWCLGSQYWSKNKHKANYAAYYGILLDMVGAKGAAFAMEGTSMSFAPEVMTNVWNTAAQGGYSQYFIYNKVNGITDDHSYVNNIAKIPMIDIIEYNDEAQSYFGWYHHTQKDNMSVIDKNTLKAVGQTVLQVLYNE